MEVRRLLQRPLIGNFPSVQLAGLNQNVPITSRDRFWNLRGPGHLCRVYYLFQITISSIVSSQFSREPRGSSDTEQDYQADAEEGDKDSDNEACPERFRCKFGHKMNFNIISSA